MWRKNKDDFHVVATWNTKRCQLLPILSNYFVIEATQYQTRDQILSSEVATFETEQ